MEKRAWVIHTLLECKDCGKQFHSHKNGQALAAKHAKHYGHYVTGEVALAIRYDGHKS